MTQRAVPFDDLVLHVAPGYGVVHRSPGTILVVPDPGPVQLHAVEELLSLCASSADPTGRRLVRQVAGLLVEHEPESVPDFCLLTQSGEEVAVMAHGDVTVSVSGERRDHFGGADSLAWVERRIDWRIETILVTGKAEPAESLAVRAPYGLQSGTVPGGGARIAVVGGRAHPLDPPTDLYGTLTPEPESPPESPPGSDRATESRSFQSVLLVRAEPPEERAPLPTTPDTPDTPLAAEEADAAAVSVVEGALCSRGHFNDPDSPFCTVCGISMLQRTRDTVLRPRPSLGVLVLDDGSAYTITSAYVIGRDPETDPAVSDGSARPLVVDDDTHSVSRVHAAITLDGWTVLLTDRGSSNGTYVSTSGQDGPWTALEPHVPRALDPSTHVRVGKRQLVFDSYHQKIGAT